MKRLLLPLLAAIALPTAVNAFPFWNDVQTENDVGEKILVKDTSVVSLNKTFQDLIPLITSYWDEVIEKEISHEDRSTLKKEQESLAFYKRRRYGKLIEIQTSILESAIDRVKKSDDRLENKRSSKESLVRQIKEIELDNTVPQINIINVLFKPISIDLNKNKTVLNQTYYSCFNPELKEEIKGLWRSYDLSIEEYNTDLYKKICKKYAKF